MTGASYRITPMAYAKMVAHVARYPDHSVNGILISSADSPSSPLIIQDAIPILHLSLFAFPSMETALELARQYCLANAKTVVGYYQANRQADDTSLGLVGELLAKKLAQTWGNRGLALVFDAAKFRKEKVALAVLPYTFSEPEWKQHSDIASVIVPTTTPEQLHKVLPSMLPQWAQRIFDFDDHYEDISLDWLQNAQLTAKIDKAFATQ
ncbi:hypothetical protein RI367_005769 [Sorochytrium milnesiophthora]